MGRGAYDVGAGGVGSGDVQPDDADVASYVCGAEVREHGGIQAVRAGESFSYDVGAAGGAIAALDGFDRCIECYTLGGKAEIHRRR